MSQAHPLAGSGRRFLRRWAGAPSPSSRGGRVAPRRAAGAWPCGRPCA